MTRPLRKRERQVKTKSGMLLWGILSTTIFVSLTTFHIWKKVELSYIARQYNGTVKSRELLVEDRVKLVAAIRARNKPGLIQAQAQEELGMIYPHRRLAVTGVGYENAPQ